MKWFKHFTNASDDEFLAQLEDEFGLEGYARWWKLIETVASQMDETSKCSVTYSWPKWEGYLKGRRKQLLCYLLRIQLLGRCKLVATEEQLTIEIPNILKIRDNHTRNLQATGKQDLEVDKEVEVDTLKSTLVVSVNKIDFEEVIKIWNENTPDSVPKIRTFDEKRKANFRARWSDELGKNMDTWKLFCSKIGQSNFMQGGSDTGWRANIDWALRPSSINKALEGQYERSQKKYNPETAWMDKYDTAK